MMLIIRRFLILLVIITVVNIGTIELYGQTYSYNIRLAVHIVRNDQGDYGIPVSEVETSVQQVNNVFTLYNSTDIHFTMSYPDYIDDDYYTTGTKLNLSPIGYSFSQKTSDLFDEKNEAGVIHIYYIKKEFTTGAAGVSHNIPGYKIIITNEDAINGETLAHEIGHCLGLLHTYNTTKFNIQPDNTISWRNGGGIPDQPENVRRAPTNHSCYNALTHGDLIHDTPADPIDLIEKVQSWVSDQCQFTPNGRTDLCDQFEYTNVKVNNVMSIPKKPTRNCSRSSFTTGQIVRMKAFLDDRLESINNIEFVDIISQNSFIEGTIKVGIDSPPIEENSPHHFTPIVGQTVNLEAQNQYYNSYERVWNDYFPNSQSDWRRNGFFFSDQVAPNFTVTQNDDNATYEAGLRKNYKIDQTHTFEFDPDQTEQNITWIVEQNSSAITAPGTLTPGTITYNFAGWTDNFGAPNPRNITPDDNLTFTALYKNEQQSNDINGYSPNNQRKFVKTPDGHLHSVYESMGTVFYERSTDGGTSWSIMQSGGPLCSGEAKHPSIDYFPDDNHYGVLITFQQKVGSDFSIVTQLFTASGTTRSDELTISVSESYNNDATPLVCIDSNNDFTLLWKQQNGFYVRTGYLWGTEDIFFNGTQNTYLSGTNQYSKNPAITANKNSTRTHLRLVWEAPGIYNSQDIYFAVLDGTTLGSPQNISDGCGYPLNYSPSISIANTKPVVSWTGYYSGDIQKSIAKETETLESYKAIVRVGPYWGSFTELGDNINYVNNNSTISSTEKTVFVWSEGTTPQSKWVKRTNGNFSSIDGLDKSGIQTQVTENSDYRYMTAMVFNTDQVPYYFAKSNEDFSVESSGGGGVSKITESSSIAYGRSGIVSKNRVEFVFNTGDIFVGDSSIQFINIPDTLLYNSASDINAISRTEDFYLNQSSEFYFSNLYYVIRHEIADTALTDDDEVNFKVEFVNSQTGEVMGVFDNITYAKTNLEKYENVHYQVDCNGIQEGEYYLRLTTAVIGDANYNISNIQADDFDLNKLSYVNVSFEGELTPDSYELSQNYPNPFNPLCKKSIRLKRKCS